MARQPAHLTEAGSQLPDSHFWETVDRLVEANGALLATYDSLIQAKESHKADHIAARRARAQATLTQEIDAARSPQVRGVRKSDRTLSPDYYQLTSQLDDIAQRLSQLVWDVSQRREYTTTVAYLDEAIDLLEGTCGGGGLTVVFGAGRELYPWRNEQAVHDVQDRLLALMART